jgi:hypothetical protein
MKWAGVWTMKKLGWLISVAVFFVSMGLIFQNCGRFQSQVGASSDGASSETSLVSSLFGLSNHVSLSQVSGEINSLDQFEIVASASMLTAVKSEIGTILEVSTPTGQLVCRTVSARTSIGSDNTMRLNCPMARPVPEAFYRIKVFIFENAESGAMLAVDQAVQLGPYSGPVGRRSTQSTEACPRGSLGLQCMPSTNPVFGVNYRCQYAEGATSGSLECRSVKGAECATYFKWDEVNKKCMCDSAQFAGRTCSIDRDRSGVAEGSGTLACNIEGTTETLTCQARTCSASQGFERVTIHGVHFCMKICPEKEARTGDGLRCMPCGEDEIPADLKIGCKKKDTVAQAVNFCSTQPGGRTSNCVCPYEMTQSPCSVEGTQSGTTIPGVYTCSTGTSGLGQLRCVAIQICSGSQDANCQCHPGNPIANGTCSTAGQVRICNQRGTGTTCVGSAVSQCAIPSTQACTTLSGIPGLAQCVARLVGTGNEWAPCMPCSPGMMGCTLPPSASPIPSPITTQTGTCTVRGAFRECPVAAEGSMPGTTGTQECSGTPLSWKPCARCPDGQTVQSANAFSVYPRCGNPTALECQNGQETNCMELKEDANGDSIAVSGTKKCVNNRWGSCAIPPNGTCLPGSNLGTCPIAATSGILRCLRQGDSNPPTYEPKCEACPNGAAPIATIFGGYTCPQGQYVPCSAGSSECPCVLGQVETCPLLAPAVGTGTRRCQATGGSPTWSACENDLVERCPGLPLRSCEEEGKPGLQSCRLSATNTVEWTPCQLCGNGAEGWTVVQNLFSGWACRPPP